MYKDESLSYINFEEGRIRVLTPVIQNNGYDGLAIDGNIDLPDGKRGALDYFVRDYQQNVRMILTQETHYGINEATMEIDRAANEEPFFGQQGSSNEVATTRFAKPGGWNANTSSSVSKLSKLTGHTIGPNSLLKVMAGDMLNAKADYYYAGPVTNNNNSQIADIVTGLIQAITGSPAVNPIVHGNTANISTELTGSLPFASLADPDKNTGDQIPRAYLNIMFFNERFEFVEEGSMVLRVSQPGDGAAPLILSNIKAPKNGYAYIYMSNENDDAVFWDNFTVSYTRGKIIEENHHFAFGLRIAGISSRKFDGGLEGSLKNDYLYNDKELWDDGDLNWYDYGFRNYDPQIARFTQLDPLTWDYPYYTPYQYAGNEPIANVDLDGLEEFKVLEPIVIMYDMAKKNITPFLNQLSAWTSRVSTLINSVKPAFKTPAPFRMTPAVQDQTRNLRVSQRHNYKSLISKAVDWIDDVSHGPGTNPVGRGSNQEAGIVFDGNGKGTTGNFTDKANLVEDNIHIGRIFDISDIYDPFWVVPRNPTVEKVVNTVDAASGTAEKVYEEVKQEKPNKSKVTIGTEPRSQPQELKMFTKDSISETNDTIQIIWYKYVPKK